MTATNESIYLEKSIPELVKALCDHAQPGSQLHEEIKGALYASLVEKLSASIDKHEKTSSNLSRQLFWLNIILGVFTVAGTALAIYSFINQGT